MKIILLFSLLIMFSFLFLKFYKYKKVLKKNKDIKFTSKSIIVIGDEEASKEEFVIRLFNEERIENMEQTISINDFMKLENWLNKNLLFRGPSIN